MSLRDLAARVHYSRGHLSKVETGQIRASVELARLCDAVLQAGGELIALVSSRRRAEPATSDLPGAAQWPALAGLSRVRVSQAENALEAFRDLFDQMRLAGQRVMPAALLPTLVAQANTLRDLAEAASGPVRSKLFTLAARYAEYIGWQEQEAGDDAAALWWTEQAVRLAAAAGDHSMSRYALVRRALVCLYRDDPAQAVMLGRLVRADSGSPPRVRGLAALHEAQGHALAGEGAQCRQALDRARDYLAQAVDDAELPTLGTTTVPDPAAMVTGWCLQDLGQPAEAAAVLDREIARIPAHARRSRARYSARRALAYATAGDVDHACLFASAVLVDASDVASATVRVDLRRLNRALLRWPSHTGVRDLQPMFNRVIR